MSATANPTPGYRGMHSFTVAIDNYFVPHANLVGEDAGMGRGFALQMGGFAVGRLQTGGRACGVAQASLEKACQYVAQREQFGKPIGEYQLTQYRIGEMVARLAAARQLTYAAAHNFDSRGLPAPMAKLLALRCRGQRLAGRAAAARRLGLLRGRPDLTLRLGRARAPDLRGREAGTRTQGRRPPAARGRCGPVTSG